MVFELQQRLDYPNFGGLSSTPITMSGNGDVLMGLGAGGYMNTPPYYIVTASGAVVDVRPTGVPPQGLSLSALSNSNIILNSMPVGFLQPSGAWAELPIPSSPHTRVSGMNSQGQVIGSFQNAHKDDEIESCLANPSGTGPVTYTLVSLAGALAKAGITGPGGALAINDAGWVLLSGNSATTYAIVNISNPNEPVLVYSSVPAIGASTMGNSGWIAGVQLDDDGTGTAFQLYNPANPADNPARPAESIYMGDASGAWVAAMQVNAPDDLTLTISNVNSSGQMVGTITSASGVGQPSVGFYWDTLNGGQILGALGLDEGAVIVGATAINDEGSVAARVLEPPWEPYGVILRPFPRLGEPGPQPIKQWPIINKPFP